MNDETHGHETYLAHHFDTPEQQFESRKLGMWLFLATEVLLFGGLFCAYAVYRSNHPEIFVYAHRFLDKSLGGINTLVLIFSSFTMAMAVRAAQLGQRRRLIGLLAVTLLCACAFLGIKAVEYEAKWKHGLLWGKHYRPVAHETHAPSTGEGVEAAVQAPAEVVPVPPPGGSPDRSLLPDAAPGPSGLSAPAIATGDHEDSVEPRNVQIFFSVYFLMTGLHGLHVIAGMVVITIVMLGAIKGRYGPRNFIGVDNAGLYWHLVDLIWIYLFPLLYLIH